MEKFALNMCPFTRIIWRSNKLRELWQERLQEASRLYNEAEWQMVAQGKRKCGTIHISKNNYDIILSRLAKDEMFFNPIAKTAPYSGFSHVHRVPKPNEDYIVYGAIAKNIKDAKLFANSETNKGTNHRIIGKLFSLLLNRNFSFFL